MTNKNYFDKMIAIIAKHTILSEDEARKKYTPANAKQSLSVRGLYKAGLMNADNQSGEAGMTAYNNDVTADAELFAWFKQNVNTLVFDILN